MNKTIYFIGLAVLIILTNSCNGIYEIEVVNQEQFFILNKYTGEVQMVAVGQRVAKWDLQTGERELVEWKKYLN
jgi:hypothetical protein